MRERPILFSAPMVRALLAGTKTQTRRVVKTVGDDDGFVLQDYGTGWWPYRSDDGESPMKGNNEIPHACPYGQPGDRLWVREAWMPDPPCDGTWGYTAWAGSRIGQIAGVPERFRKPEFCNYRATWPHKDTGFMWTPAIFMPRWASRITLEVTGVRVERLHDISSADCWAEGIPHSPDVDPVHEYRDLWESINGPESWAANPWGWVVEFNRKEAA